MEELKHALLSASSSNKWLNCTPSARLETEFENTTSEYMAEGTLAHALGELKLKKTYTTEYTTRKFNSELKKIKENPNFTLEMDRHTDTYKEVVDEIMYGNTKSPYIVIENKLDYSSYAKEGFGTVDCMIINKDALYIIDFKYGKGVAVSAEENSQLMLYALGALDKYSLMYDIRTVILKIVQPRIDNISEFTISRDEIINWGNNVVKQQAEKAYMGIGEFVTGEHCRFCRAKGNCRARAVQNLKALEIVKQNPNLLNNEEIGKALLDTINAKDWLEDIKKLALEKVLKGEDIKGWKAVEGKSNRTFTDIDSAFKKLQEVGKIEEVLLYERKPLGITALEDLLGKKKFNELTEGYIIKPKGSPTLALESDKREKYQLNTTAKEDFAD